MRFTKKDVIFEKIGVTKRTPKERFSSNYMGYKVDIIECKKMGKMLCSILERKLHEKYSSISYTPEEKGFSGKTECFEPYIIEL